MRLADRVRTAHADAWAAEGVLREPMGGGVLTLSGIRVMASGLPQPQWNGADVTGRTPTSTARAPSTPRAGSRSACACPRGCRGARASTASACA